MSETTPAPEPQEQPETPKPTPSAEDVAKLQKALASERDARKAADKRVKDLEPYEQRAREAEESSKSEQQRAADQLTAAQARAEEAERRAQATVEATNRRLVGAEARALAAVALFRNPEHAVRLLDLSDVTVGEDGAVDASAITTKLSALAESDAYLIADPKEGRGIPRPVPTQGLGSGKGATGDVAPGMPRLRDAYANSPKK